MRTDAHTIGPTGTRPLTAVFGVAQRADLPLLTMSDISRQGVSTSRRDVRRCRPGCQLILVTPEALEAKARGEDVRSPSEFAGESECGEAQELSGRVRRDCECRFEVVEQVALRRFSVSRAGAGSPSHTVDRFSTRGVLSIVHQGFFCNWSLTFTQRVGPLRFWSIF